MSSGRHTVRTAAALACLVAAAACGSGKAATTGAGGGGTAAGGGCSQQQQSGTTTVKLTVTPCPIKAGKQATLDIAVTDGSGAPVQGASVKVTSGMDVMHMSGGSTAAQAQGTGYQAKAFIGMPGPWDVHVQVRPGTGAAVEAHFTYTVK